MATTIKDIRETLTYKFDFSQQIPTDDTIDTYEIQTVDITLDSDSIDGKVITTVLSGGSDGITGEVDVLATTASGQYVQTLFVTMVDARELETSETDIVRSYIGDVDPNGEILTDKEINSILYQYKLLDPSKRIYNTVLASLVQMKALYAQSAFRSRDRELSTEVEEYGNERYQAICDLLDYYKQHPQDIIKDIELSVMKIGGTKADEYNRVASNSNGLNGIARLRRTYKDHNYYKSCPPYRTYSK